MDFSIDFLDCIRVFESSSFEREFISTNGTDAFLYSIKTPVSIRVDETVMNNCMGVYFGMDENIYFYFAYSNVDNYTFFKLKEVSKIVIS